MNTRWARLAGRLSLIALGGLCALLLLEGGLRLMEAAGLRRPLTNRTSNPALYSIFRPEYPELARLYQANGNETLRGPEFTFTIDTHGLTFDDVGFRDDGVDGDADIVAVGDSFVLGWGVEAQQGWVENLESATGRDVANLAVIGGTHKTARVLELYGLPLQPRLALFGVYANDLSENALFQAWQASGIANPDDFRESGQRQQVALFGLRKWLSENARIYQLVGEAYYQWRNPPCRYRSAELDLIFYPDQWLAGLNFDDPAIASAWTMAREDLLRAQAEAEAQGVELAFIYFPTKAQVYADFLPPCAAALTPEIADGLRDRLLAFCDENGLTCLDLTPTFRAAIQTVPQLYYTADPHWNAAGNAVAEKAIEEFVASRFP